MLESTLLGPPQALCSLAHPVSDATGGVLLITSSTPTKANLEDGTPCPQVTLGGGVGVLRGASTIEFRPGLGPFPLTLVLSPNVGALSRSQFDTLILVVTLVSILPCRYHPQPCSFCFLPCCVFSDEEA